MKKILHIIFVLSLIKLNAQTVPVNITSNQPFVVDLSSKITQPIFGLSISGMVILEDENSYVTVVLKDINGKKILIKEFFYPLYLPGQYFFSGCEEIDLIENIHSQELEIKSIGSSVYIEKIDYCMNNSDPLKSGATSMEVQAQIKVDQLNANLIDLGFLWSAGLDNSALKYSDRKGSLDFEGSSYGMEYYSRGLFTIKPPQFANNNTSSNDFPPFFDWRVQHRATLASSQYFDGNPDLSWGFNGYVNEVNGWLTKIRPQKTGDWTCINGCFAFAPTSAIEALINLYYNQHLDYDISEQDAIDCNLYNAGNCYYGGDPNLVCKYFKLNGVVDETCLPWHDDMGFCETKCSTPSTMVKISDYISVSTQLSEDFIKNELLNYGPGAGAIFGHSMALVGFGKVYPGIILNPHTGWGDPIFIDENSPLIGMNYWIFKNSNYVSWGANTEQIDHPIPI
ncbi:MAG: C1 family peptidase [Salinivirgaceae bacterium]